MKVDLSINGKTCSADVEPRKTLLDCLRDDFDLTGSHTGCEHGVCGACTVLLDGEPVRSCLMFAVQADGYEITTIEGIAPAPGELQRHPGRVLRDARPTMRLLHAGHGADRDTRCCATIRSRRETTSSKRSPATSAAAPATGRSSKRLRLRRKDWRSPMRRRQASQMRRRRTSNEHDAAPPALCLRQSPRTRGSAFRRRHGPICRRRADVPNMLHVALVPSPASRGAHRCDRHQAALALPGVHYVLTGEELAGATDPLMNGLDTPKVRRYPLALKQTRYVGEWVAAVVADTRALAEDARRTRRGRSMSRCHS